MMNAKIRIIVISLFLIFQSNTADAHVNLNDASFHRAWIDWSSDGSASLLRAYNSRSIRNGLFGFGWCSNIETSLYVHSDELVRIRDCQFQDGQMYRLQEPGLYRSQINPAESVIYKDKTYMRIRKNGSREIFSKVGRLEKLISPDGRVTHLIYSKNGLLDKITAPDGKSLILHIHARTKKIESVVLPNGQIIRYAYEDQNLKNVTLKPQTRSQTSPQTIAAYAYDQFHNLTHIRYADQSEEFIDYDSSRDQVVMLRERSGCTYFFEYRQDTDSPNFTVESKKKCADQPVASLRLDFVYSEGDEGTLILNRLRAHQGQNEAQVTRDFIFDQLPRSQLN